MHTALGYVDQAQIYLKPFFKELVACSELLARIEHEGFTRNNYWEDRQSAKRSLESARNAAYEAGMSGAMINRAIHEGGQKVRTEKELGLR